MELLNNWKKNLYVLSLLAFLLALPTSVAFITGTIIALFVVWILTGNYKEKWNRLIHNRNALLLMSIPLLYLLGLAFTNHFNIGFQELNKSLSWFFFAFILGSSPPVSHKITLRLLGIYIATVTLAAAAALLTIIYSKVNPFFNFRSVTWIDHIPFSYQIGFSIWLLIYFMMNEKISKLVKLSLLLLISFLFVTLLALKSWNGYLYFSVMSISAFIFLIWNSKKKILKLAFICGLILTIALPTLYIYHCVQKFYNITEYSPEDIPQYTPNGNLYHHDFQDKTKENGNYVMLFICDEELIPLWNARSQKKYDDETSDGYSFGNILIRYMTSKGLRKDAAGFAQLSQKDIDNIENEITNHIYATHKLSIYPRIYETIWEIDIYLMDKNPNNKSLAQRIEQALLAFHIIKKNVWVGIGLGNNADAYDRAIMDSESKLAHQITGSAHDQYLNYLIRFGILGTLYILGVLLWVFFTGRKNNPFLLTIFFVSILVTNFGEANWETFIGLNFFAFFFCFFMWIAPKK